MDADDIAGTVTSTKGPEAGVWVIAETIDLPTKVHQGSSSPMDRGAICCRICPTRITRCGLRGYGLVDSLKQYARRARP